MATRRLEAVRDYTKVVMGIAPHVSRRSRRAHALDWVATATRSWSVGWRTKRQSSCLGAHVCARDEIKILENFYSAWRAICTHEIASVSIEPLHDQWGAQPKLLGWCSALRP
jgi:hypothetical protein